MMTIAEDRCGSSARVKLVGPRSHLPGKEEMDEVQGDGSAELLDGSIEIEFAYHKCRNGRLLRPASCLVLVFAEGGRG
jgi:hypothetical protein